MAAKKPAKMANRNVGKTAPVAKDDGLRYKAIDIDRRPFYAGEGVTLADAIRLAQGMVAPAGVARVEEDGTLLPGSIVTDGEGRPEFVAIGTPAAVAA